MGRHLYIGIPSGLVRRGRHNQTFGSFHFAINLASAKRVSQLFRTQVGSTIRFLVEGTGSCLVLFDESMAKWRAFSSARRFSWPSSLNGLYEILATMLDNAETGLQLLKLAQVDFSWSKGGLQLIERPGRWFPYLCKISLLY